MMPILSTATASPTNYTSTATGVGVFVHDHEGVPHTHYFVFAVSQSSSTISPQGKFNLVCKHDNQIETIIFSTQITSLKVDPVQGGLKAVFTGSALVKMGNANWENGWTFIVTVFDYGKTADQIGVTLINPQGQIHCTVDPTSLTSGNIMIKTTTYDTYNSCTMGSPLHSP